MQILLCYASVLHIQRNSLVLHLLFYISMNVPKNHSTSTKFLCIKICEFLFILPSGDCEMKVT